jgi:hypothetical protein
MINHNRPKKIVDDIMRKSENIVYDEELENEPIILKLDIIEEPIIEIIDIIEKFDIPIIETIDIIEKFDIPIPENINECIENKNKQIENIKNYEISFSKKEKLIYNKYKKYTNTLSFDNTINEQYKIPNTEKPIYDEPNIEIPIEIPIIDISHILKPTIINLSDHFIIDEQNIEINEIPIYENKNILLEYSNNNMDNIANIQNENKVNNQPKPKRKYNKKSNNKSNKKSNKKTVNKKKLTSKQRSNAIKKGRKLAKQIPDEKNRKLFTKIQNKFKTISMNESRKISKLISNPEDKKLFSKLRTKSRSEVIKSIKEYIKTSPTTRVNTVLNNFKDEYINKLNSNYDKIIKLMGKEKESKDNLKNIIREIKLMMVWMTTGSLIMRQ